MYCNAFLKGFCILRYSQKQRKAAQRKERRRRKRQAVAQARESGKGIAVQCFWVCSGSHVGGFYLYCPPPLHIMICFITDVQGEAEEECTVDEENGEDTGLTEEERFVADLQLHHL